MIKEWLSVFLVIGGVAMALPRGLLEAPYRQPQLRRGFQVSEQDTILAAGRICTCVNYVVQKLGLKPPYANAKGMGKVLIRNGYYQVKNPQVGAVVVMQPSFPGADKTYGHTGIIVNVVDKGTMWVITLRQAGTSKRTGQSEAGCRNVNTVLFRAYSKERRDIAYYVKSAPPPSPTPTVKLPTPTPSAMPSPAVPTVTVTPTSQLTATIVPSPTTMPTQTNTSEPSATPALTETSTDIPDPTATVTTAPSATPVETETNTPIPTATETVTPAPSDTPLPPATQTNLPTATPTGPPTATPIPCRTPLTADGWMYWDTPVAGYASSTCHPTVQFHFATQAGWNARISVTTTSGNLVACVTITEGGVVKVAKKCGAGSTLIDNFYLPFGYYIVIVEPSGTTSGSFSMLLTKR